MLALLKKEMASFFSSITGALVVSVFLITTGLFLWVVPGDMNIIFSGYASLEPLFYLAPWVYLFLVPAVTMRLFADERKVGTLELLLTRPISVSRIVLAKYLSGLLVVLISLLPTLFYYFSVYYLGNPVGNVDVGGVMGSYLGLIFLAAVYVAIGVFASSLSDNQIVSFVIAVVLCFFFYSGFDSLATVPGLIKIEGFISALGIDMHYRSISRGVIDSRDVVYFASVIFFFLFSTKALVGSRK